MLSAPRRAAKSKGPPARRAAADVAEALESEVHQRGAPRVPFESEQEQRHSRRAENAQAAHIRVGNVAQHTECVVRELKVARARVILDARLGF